jgi:excisionase family DNA binding protein
MGGDNKWLSTKQAAERLGITLRTLYRLIDEGELPAYQIGRVIRLQEQEVEDFIRRSQIKPGSLRHLYPYARTETSVKASNET